MIDNTWKYYVNAKKITNEQEAYLTGIVGNNSIEKIISRCIMMLTRKYGGI